MKHLRELKQELENHQHPGAEIAEFLLHHSNSPRYLLSNLQMMNDAIQKDVEQMEERDRVLVRLSKASQGTRGR